MNFYNLSTEGDSEGALHQAMTTIVEPCVRDVTNKVYLSRSCLTLKGKMTSEMCSTRVSTYLQCLKPHLAQQAEPDQQEDKSSLQQFTR